MSVKRILKISLFSLLSLIAVAVIAVAVVINMVFSREALTAYVQDHAEDYVTCQLEIDHVELTFFSTFPEFCFHVSNISLVNPMEGAPNDTLLYVNDLYAKVDVMDYLDNEKISVTAFQLQQGRVNLYIDEEGRQNFDVCPLLMGDSTEVVDTTASMILDKIKLEGISIADFSASFLDRKHDLESRVQGLDAVLETDAELLQLKGSADLSVHAEEIFYSDALNFAQISDFHFDNCRLWSDGRNATVQLEQLKAATQEYLLSGDMALMAQIWNFILHDIDLAWQDGKPKVEVLTQLDSASVTMGEEDMLYVNIGSSQIDAPLESNDSIWQANVHTRLEHLSVAMDSEGTLIDDGLFVTDFKTSTNTAFNDFHVWDMTTSLDRQTVLGEAHYNMCDTAHQVGSAVVRLKDTSLSQLFALIPSSYLAVLEGMQVEGGLKDTRVGMDVERNDGIFVLKQVKATGALSDFAYADTSHMMASADLIGYTVVYPNSQRMSYVDMLFNGNTLVAGMDDTVSMTFRKPSGKVKVDFEHFGNRLKVQTQTQLVAVEVMMGKALTGKTGAAQLRFDALYDDTREAVLEMLRPDVDVSLQQAVFEIQGIEYPIQLPRIECSFSNNLLDIRQSEMVVGNSRLALQGTLSNLADYLDDKAMLKGEFHLGGPLIDADQLLSLVSGLGVDSTMVDEGVANSDSIAAEKTSTSVADADPFIVPQGVDFQLNTHVDKVLFNEHDFNNVAGNISCRDGALVLEEVGFTSNAANMQLTALYKSPRKNNLFVGWNFHLLDIDIAEMINLVPAIDTIAPMIKSFAGKAEFHLAGETNLFADYSPKMSTLKAVAAIEGKDLTVLDNETFQTIRKYLFKDCTTNKIDSMSVELSVARKKMSLYPMLISWDRYEAVLSGTHTVVNNMPFNYHISITKCPVVGGHLGLDIVGNMDDIDNISFKLGSCKYANLYRPEKRNVTQQQTLELKELINTSLKKTVK